VELFEDQEVDVALLNRKHDGHVIQIDGRS